MEVDILLSWYDYTTTGDLIGMDAVLIRLVMDKCRFHATPFGGTRPQYHFSFAQETQVMKSVGGC